MSEAARPRSGPGDEPAAGPALDQLNFLDLLYAVPIGDLAVRVSGAQLNRVSAADWSALALILAVIVLSWVGLHKDRAIVTGEQRPNNRIGDIRFAHAEFVQFLIEVSIIGMYFAMGLTLQLPPKNSTSASLPSEMWLTGFLFAIFAAYLLWDHIDIWRARHDKNRIWLGRATRGARVTLPTVLLWLVIFVVVSLTLNPVHTERPVVVLNLVLVAVLYGYRVAQDRWGNTSADGR